MPAGPTGYSNPDGPTGRGAKKRGATGAWERTRPFYGSRDDMIHPDLLAKREGRPGYDNPGWRVRFGGNVPQGLAADPTLGGMPLSTSGIVDEIRVRDVNQPGVLRRAASHLPFVGPGQPSVGDPRPLNPEERPEYEEFFRMMGALNPAQKPTYGTGQLQKYGVGALKDLGVGGMSWANQFRR